MMRLFRRRANKSQIDADIEQYLAEKTDALVADGFTPQEARLKARREFGNVTLTKELSGDVWNWGVVEQMARDVRYAFRSIIRNPAFSATAILTLALGIGANAAIFNLLHAVILRALPVPDAEQLRLFEVVGPQKDLASIFSYPLLLQLQNAIGNKAGLAGFSAIAPLNAIPPQGRLEQAEAQLVSGNFFDVLQVKAKVGRLLTVADDKTTAAYPAVLSDSYWAKHFAADPSVIGGSMTLNGTPVTIVGVAANSFFGFSPGRCPDLWLPVSAQFDLRFKRNVWNSNGNSDKPFITQPEIRWLTLFARIHAMEPAVLAAANQVYGLDMKREVLGWKNDPAGARDLLHSRVQLNSGDKGIGTLREKFAAPLTILMASAGLVLLIASVNLASLALARIIARRKEIAIRCSIGASRGRVLCQVVTEILVLSIIGGAMAIPVSVAASRLLVKWASNDTPIPLGVNLGWPVLLFVAAASVLAGLLFGLLPSLEAINFPLADSMKAQSGGVKGMRLPWGRTLIAVQVMLSFVLLTGAVLFVRTLLNYANMELGFTPQHVLSVQVDPLGGRFPTEQLLPTYHRILAQLKEIPGVESASFAECGLALGCKSVSGIRVEGGSPDERIQQNYVNPEYFHTVGMRLISGRTFTLHDISKQPLLAVINSSAARQLFLGETPLGRHFGFGDGNQFEVIGVIADARVNDLHEKPQPMAYYSLEQDPQYVRSLEVRVVGDPAAVEQSVKRVIRDSAAGLPVTKVRLLTHQVESNLLREKLVARLASVFAALALGLSCLGVYGVLSYAISRRTPEIGIRLALGASENIVRWMVIEEALSTIFIGLALGVPLSLTVTTMVRGMLYGLSPSDPMTMVMGALTILAIGLIAAFVPAFRASRVDPNVALRYE